MAEFKMAAIIKMSQNEWVKFFFVQMVGTSVSEWIWEEDNKVSESKMAVAESNMADFKMAAIIKFESESE